MLDSRNQIHISESYFVWSCMQSVNYNHFPLPLWLLGEGGWMGMRHAPFYTWPQEQCGRRHLGGTWCPSEALQVLREKACLWLERTWQRGWCIEGPEHQLQVNEKRRKKVGLFPLTSTMISSSLSKSSRFISEDWWVMSAVHRVAHGQEKKITIWPNALEWDRVLRSSISGGDVWEGWNGQCTSALTWDLERSLSTFMRGGLQPMLTSTFGSPCLPALSQSIRRFQSWFRISRSWGWRSSLNLKLQKGHWGGEETKGEQE